MLRNLDSNPNVLNLKCDQVYLLKPKNCPIHYLELVFHVMTRPAAG